MGTPYKPGIRRCSECGQPRNAHHANCPYGEWEDGDDKTCGECGGTGCDECSKVEVVNVLF